MVTRSCIFVQNNHLFQPLIKVEKEGREIVDQYEDLVKADVKSVAKFLVNLMPNLPKKAYKSKIEDLHKYGIEIFVFYYKEGSIEIKCRKNYII